MSRQISLLKEYPSKALFALSSGAFLFTVLYLYQAYQIPTEVSSSGHSLLLRAFLFGVATTTCFYFLEVYLSPLLTRHAFAKSKTAMVSWVFFEILVGTVANFILFNVFWNWINLSWQGFAKMGLEFTGVFIVPYTISVVYQMYRDSSRSARSKVEKLTLQSSNAKEKITLSMNSILFIKAEDNYVNITFENSEGVKKKLLRNTLSAIEKSVAQNGLWVRSHRSYIVNLIKVKQVHQKNNQVVLHFDENLSAPVSDKFKSNVLQQMANLR